MTNTNTDCGKPAGRGALSRRAFLGRAAGVGVAATAAAGPFAAAMASTQAEDGKPFLIGLEEHFATRELQRLNAGTDKRLFSGGGRRPELLDLGAGRIADMDEAGIDIQVLSAVTPGAQNLPGADGVAFARRLNSWVANEVVAARPDRFRAFATLPLGQPEAAADELERSVRERGFVGCMSYGPIDGRFLDHANFAPLLARAEALRVPIYIHPNWPSPRVREVYYDGLGDALASKILGGPGYGWHQEVALQCLRLIVAGTFDRYPKLQIVVGHMGDQGIRNPDSILDFSCITDLFDYRSFDIHFDPAGALEQILDLARRRICAAARDAYRRYVGRALDPSVYISEYTRPLDRLPGLDVDWERRNAVDGLSGNGDGALFRGAVGGGQ